MDSQLDIHDYTIDHIIKILVGLSEATEQATRNKQHVKYLDRYLSKIKAKTIVVEYEYVDRDYLEDYAAYYSRCFKPYERKCVRVHFFSHHFDTSEFNIVLSEPRDNSEALGSITESYLGFLVIKPLPKTPIGRTCISTYPENGNRFFLPTRDYTVNLCGLELEVRSLAFQEQDRAVSACATSALWASFQKTGELFQHSIPSPVEITKAAERNFPGSSRGLPSQGLTVEQIAGAIRGVGLEPYLIKAENKDFLRKVLHAYTNLGVPSLLLFRLYLHRDQKWTSDGLHAVTVSGLSYKSRLDEIPCEETAKRIDKIFVHDDQAGPFAKMELDPDIDVFDTTNMLDCAWDGNSLAEPMFLMVPLYHKIRIPFDVISPIVSEVAQLIKLACEELKQAHYVDLEWDLKLCTINDLRKYWFQNAAIPIEKRVEILSSPLPRFIWRVAIKKQEIPLLDLLFDATDLDQGQTFERHVTYDDDFGKFIHAISEPLAKVCSGSEVSQVFLALAETSGGQSSD